MLRRFKKRKSHYAKIFANKMEESSQKKENNKQFIGKKIERSLEGIKTTDNSVQKKEDISKSESLSEEIYECKNVINFQSSNNTKEKKIQKIFSDYGDIKEIKMKNKKNGWIEFCDNRSAQLAMENKEKIYSENKLSISYNRVQIKKIKETLEEESKNSYIEEIEESDNSDEVNIIEENKMGGNEKKSKYESKEKESEKESYKEDKEESNKKEYENSLINKNDNKIKEKNAQNYKTIEELSNKVKELENTIDEYKNKYDADKKKYEADKKKNENDKKILFKSLGIITEINNQTEKYVRNNLNVKINNLKNKLELILNSYKILYIRKLSNILLGKLYDEYEDILEETKVKKDHYVTTCRKNIKGVSKNNINCIIDFLKHIKIKASDIIHIEDEKIKFQKEILYEYLDVDNSDDEKLGKKKR